MDTKFFEFASLLVAFLAYPLLAKLVLGLGENVRWRLFAVLNLFATYIAVLSIYVLVHLPFNSLGLTALISHSTKVFVVYVAMIVMSYLALEGAVGLRRFPVWVAYAAPIASLIVFKLATAPIMPSSIRFVAVVFLGISFVLFRLCHLVSEVQNGLTPKPSFSQYLAYAYYVPILFVGPITPYAPFYESVNRPQVAAMMPLRSVARIVTGLIKFVFLSAVLSQLTYGQSFLRDGHMHGKFDFILAILVYPLFLYVNFSGLCDVAVGVSGLLGIQIMENFDRPFSSRNFQEFWARWHITLSLWMRDMVFTPMVKSLTRKVGQPNINHVIALGIFAVFILIGLWHGLTLNFVLFGLSQAIGVAFVHYSNVFLKKRLSKVQYKQFKSSRAFYAAGVACTYLYFSLTMFLFANTMEDAKAIFSHLI